MWAKMEVMVNGPALNADIIGVKNGIKTTTNVIPVTDRQLGSPGSGATLSPH